MEKFLIHFFNVSNCSDAMMLCYDVFFFLLVEDDDRELAKLEEKVWDPNSPLTEKQIDQFLVVAR